MPSSFGPEYLIPKPFDPRLIVKIAPAVAKAAMDSGVATRPITDWEAYSQQLNEFRLALRPDHEAGIRAAKQHPKRIVFAEGEDERVLRAVQTVLDEGIAQPILIGRPHVVEMYVERFGLRMHAGKDFELVNPESDSRYRELWTHYHAQMERKGVSEAFAKAEVRRRMTLIGSLLLKFGYADGMICGTFGMYTEHLRFIRNVVGLRMGVRDYYAANLLSLPGRTVVLCDTYVNYDPTRRTDRRDDRSWPPTKYAASA